MQMHRLEEGFHWTTSSPIDPRFLACTMKKRVMKVLFPPQLGIGALGLYITNTGSS
jgi:hypothetical protein